MAARDLALRILLDIHRDAIRERLAGRPLQSQPGDRGGIFALVGRDCAHRRGDRIHHAADDASTAGSRRVGGIPVLLENSCTAFAGAVSRLRQWTDDRRHEVRPGRGDVWRWAAYG